MHSSRSKGFLAPLILIAVVMVSAIAVVYFESDLKPTPASDSAEPVVSQTPPAASSTVEAVTEQRIGVPLSASAELSEPGPQLKAVSVQKSQLLDTTFKTYTSTEFGFSIKYPAALDLEEGKVIPNTRFVVFKDPGFDNSVVSTIYISEAAKLPASELALGVPLRVGNRDGKKFTDTQGTFYWVETGKYSVAISFSAPSDAPKDYALFPDLSSFAF